MSIDKYPVKSELDNPAVNNGVLLNEVTIGGSDRTVLFINYIWVEFSDFPEEISKFYKSISLCKYVSGALTLIGTEVIYNIGAISTGGDFFVLEQVSLSNNDVYEILIDVTESNVKIFCRTEVITKR